jgi:hypothetical protein
VKHPRPPAAVGQVAALFVSSRSYNGQPGPATEKLAVRAAIQAPLRRELAGRSKMERLPDRVKSMW